MEDTITVINRYFTKQVKHIFDKVHNLICCISRWEGITGCLLIKLDNSRYISYSYDQFDRNLNGYYVREDGIYRLENNGNGDVSEILVYKFSDEELNRINYLMEESTATGNSFKLLNELLYLQLHHTRSSKLIKSARN